MKLQKNKYIYIYIYIYAKQIIYLDIESKNNAYAQHIQHTNRIHIFIYTYIKQKLCVYMYLYI